MVETFGHLLKGPNIGCTMVHLSQDMEKSTGYGGIEWFYNRSTLHPYETPIKKFSELTKEILIHKELMNWNDHTS